MLKDFKKPDLNAPRYFPIIFNPINKGFFKKIREEHPQLSLMTDKQIRKVIKVTNESMADMVLEHRDGVEFPESIGYCFLGTCPEKKTPNIDYKLSAELGKTVQHRNWDSDGFIGKIFYTNYETKYKFKFNDMWTFVACRTFTRLVPKIYPKNWKKYIQVAPVYRIARLFRKQKAYQHAKKNNIVFQDFGKL